MINAKLLVQNTLGASQQTEEIKTITIFAPQKPEQEQPEQEQPVIQTNPQQEQPEVKPEVPAIGEEIPAAEDAIQVIASSQPRFSEATVKLALAMAENHKVMKGLLSDLRKVAQTSSKEFRYDLSSFEPQERDRFLDITKTMSPLLCDTYYNKTTCVLQGRMSAVPACLKFLNGGYLETAVAHMTREITGEYAASRGLSWEVMPNALVTDGISKNELDLLLTVDGKHMVVEVKSGNCKTYDKYYFLGQRYKLLPDAMLLVGANISPEEADIVHDFMEYTVCDLSGYREHLIAMLNKNCGGKEHV